VVRWADSMTQAVEEYFKEKMSEQISIHDKKVAKILLQNGASLDLVKKSFPSLSVEYIEKLGQNFQ
jgi:hypothetical protein